MTWDMREALILNAEYSLLNFDDFRVQSPSGWHLFAYQIVIHDFLNARCCASVSLSRLRVTPGLGNAGRGIPGTQYLIIYDLYQS